MCFRNRSFRICTVYTIQQYSVWGCVGSVWAIVRGSIWGSVWGIVWGIVWDSVWGILWGSVWEVSTRLLVWLVAY